MLSETSAQASSGLLFGSTATVATVAATSSTVQAGRESALNDRDDEDNVDEYQSFVIESTGQEVSNHESIKLLSDYCAYLATDKYFIPKPSFDLQARLVVADVVYARLNESLYCCQLGAAWHDQVCRYTSTQLPCSGWRVLRSRFPLMCWCPLNPRLKVCPRSPLCQAACCTGCLCSATPSW